MIERITDPGSVWTTQADYQAQNENIRMSLLDTRISNPITTSGQIRVGATFNIGGAIYLATSPESITGTPSEFVRLVPDGSECTAEYAANLTGVAWNDTFSGYYDVSGNYYIFDEGKAIADGLISTARYKFLAQTKDGDVLIGRDLSVKRDASIGNNLAVAGVISGPTIDSKQPMPTTSSNQNLTDYPVGTTIPVATGTSTFNRNASITPRLSSSSPSGFDSFGAGSTLTGTWRIRGLASIFGSPTTNYIYLSQRVS
jgi:hypothetical protein